MLNKPQDKIVINDTCFAARARYKSKCLKSNCRYWINDASSFNCSLIAAAQGGMTLEQVGEIFGLTRMRVCQIEKNICRKIISQLSSTTQADDVSLPQLSEAKIF